MIELIMTEAKKVSGGDGCWCHCTDHQGREVNLGCLVTWQRCEDCCKNHFKWPDFVCENPCSGPTDQCGGSSSYNKTTQK